MLSNLRLSCLLTSYSPRSYFIILNFSYLFCVCIDSVAAICYYPDESVSFQDVPCSDSDIDSNCCGPGYECLSNKICSLAHRDGAGGFLDYNYGRGSCTDQKWRSSACPSLCILYSGNKSLLPTSTVDQLISLHVTDMYNCDRSQTVENSYCCLSSNGTLTQDGLNQICDCGLKSGIQKPLHFEVSHLQPPLSIWLLPRLGAQPPPRQP